MTETTAQERRSIFQRPEEPRPLRITERDCALMRNIARMRVASSNQLAALDGGSEQNVSRCLRALWEHRYIERLLGQVTNRRLYEGSLPTMYALTRRGAAFLRKAGYEVRRRLLDGIDKDRTAGWHYIEHKGDITEFLVRLELAADGREDISVIPRNMILEDAPKTRRDRRVRLTAKVRIDGVQKQQSADPDELFGLRFLPSEEESYFMFERDRGKMPIERLKSKQQTFFSKKMLIYYEANRQGIHKAVLGIPNFRVATVTTSAARVEDMIDAVFRMTDGKGSNIFLFVDDATLAASNPLDVVWTSGKGEPVRLTD